MFKPMKPPSGVLEDADLKWVRFPVIGSPKLDGFRISNQEGRVRSSTLAPIPNRQIQAAWGLAEFEGLDGEVVVGSPTEQGAIQRTSSIVTTAEANADAACWYIFDKYHPTLPYTERRKLLIQQLSKLRELKLGVVLVQTKVLNNLEELLAYEQECINAGYEGMMLNNPRASYKQGRSTITDQGLLRRKPFLDGEGVIIGFEQGESNQNPVTINALGRSKRSTAKSGIVKVDTLGTFVVRGLTVYPGVVFPVGAFGTLDERRDIWRNRDQYLGKILKFKFQRYGSKNSPRVPIGLGFRDPSDITLEK